MANKGIMITRTFPPMRRDAQSAFIEKLMVTGADRIKAEQKQKQQQPKKKTKTK